MLFRVLLNLLLALAAVNTLSNQEQIIENGKFPLVLNTWAFREANEAAWKTLTSSNAESKTLALDALVEGCSTCERLQCDGTVGFGGSPDEEGETTLDAMIMDGSTMNVGAVGSLHEIKDASRAARLVLERSRHSFLVGNGASNFAAMMGLKRESLSTTKSQEIWRNWKENKCQPNFWNRVTPDSNKECGPYKPEEENSNEELYSENDERGCPMEGEQTSNTCSQNNLELLDQWHHDTIGMIVVDQKGNIFAGTSTNGANHKIPGRVGDSPIVGAGAYADNEVGAAVATGDGDILMRFLPTFLAVELMRNGKSPHEAAMESLARIQRYYSSANGAIVVMDRWGNYSASCIGFEKGFPYMVSDRRGGTREEQVRTCH